MDIVCLPQGFLFHALFSSISMLAFVGSLYLLFRRGNAFAAGITPPLRLRRWAATFFAASCASHLAWLFIYYGNPEGDFFHRIMLCTAFDLATSLPILLCTMLAMLQDRRRPLWPVFAMSALSLVYMFAIYLLGIQSTALCVLPVIVIFFIFTIGMVFAIRQYEHWLRDNYADLEHKEVRHIFAVMSVLMLTTVSYSLANDFFFFEVLIEVGNFLLIFVMLWRVETLQTLEVLAEAPTTDTTDTSDTTVATVTTDTTDGTDTTDTTDMSAYLHVFGKIEERLQQRCIDKKYYLNHGISLVHLAKLIGTNSTYLSRYFSYHGMSYNTYINRLRIEHFMRLYQANINANQSVTAAELAKQCGYRNYITFSSAFKNINGQTAKEWMHQQESKAY